MIYTLYKAGVRLYFFLIRVAALFNPKAALFYKGRRNLFKNIEENLPQSSSPLVWFHAASLGEFEQGRPVIEALKRQNPGIRILLTFFSPSGFEVRKGYPMVDYICYLPIESDENVKRFYDLVRPSLAVFIKYEFWKQYLDEAKQRHVKLISISSIFRDNQFFFKKYGAIFRESLHAFDHFFVQNLHSKQLLATVGILQTTVAGDTRFDRVSEIRSQTKPIALAESFRNKEPVVVFGSVWPSDMQALYPAIHALANRVKFIIAPHQIENDFLRRMEMRCKTSTVRYSRAKAESVADHRILLIDNIGMLSSLYGYGDLAFVGGGFRGALHNTLEPAAFGIPVLWGDHPKNSKFREVTGLIESGGGIPVKAGPHAQEVLERLIANPAERESAGTAAGAYVTGNTGATQKIVAYINELLSSYER